VLADVAGDGVLEFGDGPEDTSPDAPSSDGGEEALDGVDPRRRLGCEMEDPARVIGQPRQHLRVFVGGVVVDDGVDDLACRDCPFHGIEEDEELLVGLCQVGDDGGAGAYVCR
jgi:hypothetical protein